MNENKVISIASRKGGVGKSTTARNLGYYLAEQEYRVLIVDTDSQGNLSTGFGEHKTATTVGTIVEPMWAVMQDEPVPSNESFIKHTNGLYILGNYSGDLFALDTATGKQIWSLHLGKCSIGSNLTIQDNAVYCGTGLPQLYGGYPKRHGVFKVSLPIKL